MANSLYKLLVEFDKMDISDGYIVSFDLGKKDTVILRVHCEDHPYRTSWAVSRKELELCKLDFIKENIEAMIDSLEEMRKEDDNVEE